MSNELGDRLLGQQRRDEASEERFKEEMRKMTETKLTTAKRVAWALSGLMGIFFVFLFGYYAWTALSELPLIARLIFVAGAVFGAFWAVICGNILKKGSINLRTDENMVHGLVWGFMVLMMTALLVVGGMMNDRVLGIYMVLYGLVFFIMFAIPSVLNLRVNRLELGLREQIVSMQITLAEIVENQVTHSDEGEE
jgi:hypothetical protein